jgi:hypothetical protein
VDAIFFRVLNVLHSPLWHEMVQSIHGAPKGYKSLGYDKARTLGFEREIAKIHGALGKITNGWNHHGINCI